MPGFLNEENALIISQAEEITHIVPISAQGGDSQSDEKEVEEQQHHNRKKHAVFLDVGLLRVEFFDQVPGETSRYIPANR